MALADYLGPSLQIGSTILSAGGQMAKGNAARVVGTRRKDLSEYEAKQLEEEAVQSRGVGMRTAQDMALKTELVNSAALARASASGAGASDPTVMAVLARTSSEGAYRQMVAMYEGEAQARLDLMRADATRFEGNTSEADSRVAQKASNIGAASTALSGGAKVSTMFDKYWAGPKNQTSGGGYTSGQFLEGID